MPEFVIVTFVRGRRVFLDDQPFGRTGDTLTVQAGFHDFDLGSPADYMPARQTANVVNTTSEHPLVVTFDPLLMEVPEVPVAPPPPPPQEMPSAATRTRKRATRKAKAAKKKTAKKTAARKTGTTKKAAQKKRTTARRAATRASKMTKKSKVRTKSKKSTMTKKKR